MTQDDRWDKMWQKYMHFMKVHKHCPSKYKASDMQLVNWAKYNRKLRNKDLMLDTRKDKFNKLLEMAESLRRINQHAYIHPQTEAEEGQLFPKD